MEIKDKNFNNTSTLQEQIISYIKNNPCCEFYPTCTHPKHQSDSYLHESIDIFKDSLYNSLLTKNIKATITHLWAFVTYENEVIKHQLQLSEDIRKYSDEIETLRLLANNTKTSIDNVLDNFEFLP